VDESKKAKAKRGGRGARGGNKRTHFNNMHSTGKKNCTQATRMQTITTRNARSNFYLTILTHHRYSQVTPQPCSPSLLTTVLRCRSSWWCAWWWQGCWWCSWPWQGSGAWWASWTWAVNRQNLASELGLPSACCTLRAGDAISRVEHFSPAFLSSSAYSLFPTLLFCFLGMVDFPASLLQPTPALFIQ
jgi:hypothetical protein